MVDISFPKLPAGRYYICNELNNSYGYSNVTFNPTIFVGEQIGFGDRCAKIILAEIPTSMTCGGEMFYNLTHEVYVMHEDYFKNNPLPSCYTSFTSHTDFSINLYPLKIGNNLVHLSFDNDYSYEDSSYDSSYSY